MPECLREVQVSSPEVVYSRLSKPDARTLRLIARRLNTVFVGSSRRLDSEFLALMAVGGVVTKSSHASGTVLDRRPDTDLVVVSNLAPRSAYSPPVTLRPRQRDAIASVSRGDRVVGAILETVIGKYNIADMDSEHDIGCGPKVVFRLEPRSRTEARRPFDISVVDGRKVGGGVRSITDFEQHDVDHLGNPLPKVVLARFGANAIS